MRSPHQSVRDAQPAGGHAAAARAPPPCAPAANFILPVFVHDGEENIPIDSMPGVARLGWRHGLLDAVKEARSVGVNQVRLLAVWCSGWAGIDRWLCSNRPTPHPSHRSHPLDRWSSSPSGQCPPPTHTPCNPCHPKPCLQVVIFPKTPEHLKTPTAEEAFNPNGLAQRTISLLKDTFPDLEVRLAANCWPQRGCAGRLDSAAVQVQHQAGVASSSCPGARGSAPTQWVTTCKHAQ